jgi:hypothetical protein
MQVRPGLANAIDVVRKRIQQIRDRKEIIGEQNTKAALIDPILVALGWDLQEIEVPGKGSQRPQVDFAESELCDCRWRALVCAHQRR